MDGGPFVTLDTAISTSFVALRKVVFSSFFEWDKAVFSPCVALDEVVFSEGSLGRDFLWGFFGWMGERPLAGFSLEIFSSRLSRPVLTLPLFPSASKLFFGQAWEI